MEIDLRRRFFAEELEAVCKLRTPALVDAFARVPRDPFLPPGPWTVLSDSGDSYLMGGGIRTRLTPDADPARVHHNIAVAIDAARQLCNGQPATLGAWIDALDLVAGLDLAQHHVELFDELADFVRITRDRSNVVDAAAADEAGDLDELRDRPEDQPRG